MKLGRASLVSLVTYGCCHRRTGHSVPFHHIIHGLRLDTLIHHTFSSYIVLIRVQTQQCFCGTTAEFNASKSSDQCGVRGKDFCSGASAEVCGGNDAISIYRRLSVSAPTPVPAAPKPVTPAPVKPLPHKLEGCYKDDKHDRTFSQLPMLVKMTLTDGMNVEVRDLIVVALEHERSVYT